MLLLRLSQGISSGVTMPPRQPIIFYLYLPQCMAVIVSPSFASTHLGYFYRLPPFHLYTKENFLFVKCVGKR